jgi:hypothetical protein
VVLAILVGCLLLLITNLLIWVDTTLLDGEEFASATFAALDTKEVQDRLAEVIAAEILATGELQDRIDTELPEQLSFLGPVIESRLGTILETLAGFLLASDLVQRFEEPVANLHARLLAILEGDDSRLQVEGGALVLDLSGPLNRVRDAVGIGDSQGGGSSAAQVTLIEDTSALEQASWAVSNRQEIIALCLLGTILFFALAVVFSRSKSRGVLTVCYSIAGVGVLTLVALFVSNAILSSEGRVVLENLVRQLAGNLRLQSIALIVLGLCAVAIADARIRSRIGAAEERLGKAVAPIGTTRAVVIGAAGLVALALVAS